MGEIRNLRQNHRGRIILPTTNSRAIDVTRTEHNNMTTEQLYLECLSSLVYKSRFRRNVLTLKQVCCLSVQESQWSTSRCVCCWVIVICGSRFALGNPAEDPSHKFSCPTVGRTPAAAAAAAATRAKKTCRMIMHNDSREKVKLVQYLLGHGHLEE